MPIAYSIDHLRQLVLENWAGDITATDVKAHWKKMLADPEALAIGKSLTDLRKLQLPSVRS